MPSALGRHRPRRDGTVGYTAQVKVWRGGRVILTRAETFDREQATKACLAET